MGGGGALLLSHWGIALTRRSIPSFIVEHVAGLKHLQLDSRVFLFTLVVAIATGLVTGLAPAWHLSRPNVNDTLKEGGRNSTPNVVRHRLRRLFRDLGSCSLARLAGGGRNHGEGLPVFDGD